MYRNDLKNIVEWKDDSFGGLILTQYSTKAYFFAKNLDEFYRLVDIFGVTHWCEDTIESDKKRLEEIFNHESLSSRYIKINGDSGEYKAMVIRRNKNVVWFEFVRPDESQFTCYFPTGILGNIEFFYGMSFEKLQHIGFNLVRTERKEYNYE